MIGLSVVASFLLLAVSAHQHHAALRRSSQTAVIGDSALTINGIPFSTRAYWMRRANEALAQLSSACPFAAFGSVIVNHTDPGGLGELVCIGANSNSGTGNPTLHGKLRCPSGDALYFKTRELNRTRKGEIAAISNCSSVLTDPNGPYKFSASEALAAFADLSLYTNAESCPMVSASHTPPFLACTPRLTKTVCVSDPLGWLQRIYLRNHDRYID